MFKKLSLMLMCCLTIGIYSMEHTDNNDLQIQQTPYTQALDIIREGSLEELKKLVSTHNKIYFLIIDNDGNSLLHWAAFYQRQEMVDFLVNEMGIDPTIVNNAGQIAQNSMTPSYYDSQSNSSRKNASVPDIEVVWGYDYTMRHSPDTITRMVARNIIQANLPPEKVEEFDKETKHYIE